MGKAWVFGDDVNTDLITPSRFNLTTDEKELAQACFCEARPGFSVMVKPGDFLVAGENFGCGSSREHAPVAIKACGIKAVIAQSFARIFLRNAINIGLPVLVCDGAGKIHEGDELDADLQKGTIKNITKDEDYKAQPLPGFILRIVQAGGIIPYLKRHSIDELND
ncbi:MAG: 3-isopropylmalate dehydratase small subunit [archaeon]